MGEFKISILLLYVKGKCYTLIEVMCYAETQVPLVRREDTNSRIEVSKMFKM